MSHEDRTARSSRTFRRAAAERMAEYTRLRDARFTMAQAAGDIGVSVSTARHSYEPGYQRGLPEEGAEEKAAPRGDEAA